MNKIWLIVAVVFCGWSALSDALYTKFQPKETSRKLENIEWSITYSFNAPKTEEPRILMIGDSICNGYQLFVRSELSERVNVTYWVSSKCVTDRNYFRELDFVLSSQPFSMITFNNGLHSLTTDRKEFEAAYRAVVRFIRAKLPNVPLVIVNSTPLMSEEKTKLAKEINVITGKIAKEEKLQLIDLFAAMDPLDRKEAWSDEYHFTESARKIQASMIAEVALETIKTKGGIVQQGTETGPDGKLK